MKHLFLSFPCDFKLRCIFSSCKCAAGTLRILSIEQNYFIIDETIISTISIWFSNSDICFHLANVQVHYASWLWRKLWNTYFYHFRVIFTLCMFSSCKCGGILWLLPFPCDFQTPTHIFILQMCSRYDTHPDY